MWMIKGVVSQPIFNAATWYGYRLVKVKQEEVLLNYRKAILTALKEVSNQLTTKQQTGKERQHREEQVKALQHSVSLADVRYREGQSTYIDLLDAERQLLSARILFEQVKRDEFLATIKLYKALGGGTKISADDIVVTQKKK